MNATRSLVAALASAAMLTGPATADSIITFDEGLEGWTGPGGSTIEADGGNPGANWHTIFNNFGVTYSAFDVNNPDFATDYTQFDSVTISVDLKVNDISFFGSPVQRPWVLELRDYDNPPGSYPYVSVWYEFAWVGQGPDYVTWSVTIADTSSAALPAGWGGYGDENEFAEPILPPGRTFTDVLAGIDEIAFTTLEPGYFFGFTDFDLQIDNIAIATTGGPTTCEGDVDGDDVIDFGDLLAVLAAWGPCPGCPEDLTADDAVGFDDLLLLLSLWGPCP